MIFNRLTLLIFLLPKEIFRVENVSNDDGDFKHQSNNILSLHLKQYLDLTYTDQLFALSLLLTNDDG